MNEIAMVSMCLLIGATAGLVSCSSGAPAVEAKSAADQPSPSVEPAATAPGSTDGPSPAAASAAPATAAPATAGEPSAEDDTWTDEPGAGTAAGAAAAPAAADQPETRTMEVIRKFVQDRREKVRPCYDKVQAGRPNFKGDVMMRFVLSPSGTVQQIYYDQAESTLYSPEMGECIGREMKTWQFPPSSRHMETKVGYPFNFNPRKK